MNAASAPSSISKADPKKDSAEAVASSTAHPHAHEQKHSGTTGGGNGAAATDRRIPAAADFVPRVVQMATKNAYPTFDGESAVLPLTPPRQPPVGMKQL